jgi:predicted small lipoprotein YifL
MRVVLAALALLVLPLAACDTVGPLTSPSGASAAGAAIDATGATAPAPLNATTIDDKALIVALQSADTIATSIDALVAAKVIVPGTPRALAVQSALKRLKSFLQAASAAQRAGSATSYARALGSAATAAKDIQSAIRGQ